MPDDTAPLPSGMTIDGQPVPLHVEALGGEAIESFLTDPASEPSAVAAQPDVDDAAAPPSDPSEGAPR